MDANNRFFVSIVIYTNTGINNVHSPPYAWFGKLIRVYDNRNLKQKITTGCMGSNSLTLLWIIGVFYIPMS